MAFKLGNTPSENIANNNFLGKVIELFIHKKGCQFSSAAFHY
jgi:hypothetical protein